MNIAIDVWRTSVVNCRNKTLIGMQIQSVTNIKDKVNILATESIEPVEINITCTIVVYYNNI